MIDMASDLAQLTLSGLLAAAFLGAWAGLTYVVHLVRSELDRRDR